MTEKPGIYQILHLASGKVYIGSAANISKRWSRHRKDLREGTHTNPHLQAAWSLYGEEAFEFSILEITSGDLKELTEREQYWIDATGCADTAKGYNLCPIARTSRGRPSKPLSLSHRASLSKATKGKRGFGLLGPKPLRGEDNHSTKLTAEQVQEIREKYGPWNPRHHDPSRPSMQQLADEYGVKLMAISDIVRGKTWRHLGEVEKLPGLTEGIKAEIRERYGPWEPPRRGPRPKYRTVTMLQLAKEYHLHTYTIRAILEGKL